MMKVIGEEGTLLEDFIVYLKSEFLDSVYIQQNAFDEVDAATVKERQEYVFSKVLEVLEKKFSFKDKVSARGAFHKLRQLFIDWNYKPWESGEFKIQEKEIDAFLNSLKDEKSS